MGRLTQDALQNIALGKMREISDGVWQGYGWDDDHDRVFVRRFYAETGLTFDYEPPTEQERVEQRMAVIGEGVDDIREGTVEAGLMFVPTGPLLGAFARGLRIGAPVVARALRPVGKAVGANAAAWGAIELSTTEISAMLQTGLQPFKTTELTAAGMALTKHPELLGLTKTNFSETLRSPGAINAAAEEVLGSILRSGTAVRATSGRFGQVLNVTGASGLGARFSEAGKFIGFLNP